MKSFLKTRNIHCCILNWFHGTVPQRFTLYKTVQAIKNSKAAETPIFRIDSKISCY